jgi:putative IMPACT (imprinted ancient) family translation regulator
MSDVVDRMSELEDEVCAINSIYEHCMVEWAPWIYDVQVADSGLVVRLSFPRAYPSKRPKIMAVIKGNTSIETAERVLDSVFREGQVVVFDFVEVAREELQKTVVAETTETDPEPHQSIPIDVFNGWTSGETVTDRKSAFVGRACEVHSGEQAMEKIALLKLDKKIARATHNMTAYRIRRHDGVVLQDCDDDGETAAGGRLLHLLTLTDCWNVVVCVSRWYGGIQLGPDRFKHINSCARDALVQGGFIDVKAKK